RTDTERVLALCDAYTLRQCRLLRRAARIRIAMSLRERFEHRLACERTRAQRILVGAEFRDRVAKSLAKLGKIVSGIVRAQRSGSTIRERRRIERRGCARGPCRHGTATG